MFEYLRKNFSDTHIFFCYKAQIRHKFYKKTLKKPQSIGWSVDFIESRMSDSN